jgi:hypothetical protein
MLPGELANRSMLPGELAGLADRFLFLEYAARTELPKKRGLKHLKRGIPLIIADMCGA